MVAEKPSILAGVDLYDPDLFLSGYPHDIWTMLRREAPVFWHEPAEGRPGFWAITKHEDVVSVSRNPSTFSSSRLFLYQTDQDSDVLPMIFVDPPRHVMLRKLVNKGFTPRQIALLEPHVREIVTEIIDAAAPLGTCDFVADIAGKLPLAIICEMMGVPRQDWQLIYEWTNTQIGAGDPEYMRPGEAPADAGARATREEFEYIAQMVAQRRQQPTSDLVTTICESEVEGERLSDAEILAFCMLLFVGGNETTRNATSGGMLALIENPDQRALLLREPSLIPSAVEEILRWTSPIIQFGRLVREDTEIRGQPIRKGEMVIIWYPSANRDEEVFEEPFRFDVRRDPNDHLAFGTGEHFCLGASLARLELRVMFEELLKRLPDMELAGPVERLRSNLVGGIKHMPVRYTPA